MSSLRRQATIVAIGLSAAFLRADILDHIPANAKLVVVAKDIQTLEKDLQAYAGKLDLPIDPAMIELNALTVLAGLPVELGKQAALVITDITPAGLIIMVELADPKAVSSLPGVEAVKEDDEEEDDAKEKDEKDDEEDDDVDYRIEIMGMPAIIEVEGNLAKVQINVTDDEGLEAVEEVKQPLSAALTAHQKKILSRSDLFFWLNVVEWRELANQGINMMHDQMGQVFDQLGENQIQPGGVPGISIKDVFDWYFNGAKTLVKETHSFYGGLAVEADDVHLLLAADYEPGSGMESAFKPASVSVKDLLQGLPDRPYLMVSGTDVDSIRKAFIGFATGAMRAMFAEVDPKILKQLENNLGYLDQTKTMSMLFDMGRDNAFEGLGFYHSDEPKTLFESFKKLSAEGGQQMALFGTDVPNIEIHERTIAGRPAFEYTMDLSKAIPKNPDPKVQASQESMFRLIYGEDMTMTVQVDLREKGIGYATSNIKDPILLLDSPKQLFDNPLVTRTLKPLAAKGTSVGLLDFTGAVRLITKIMKSQNLPVNLPEIPGPSPPIGMLMEVEKGMTAIDVVVPAETTKSMIAFGMKVFQSAGQAAQEEMEDEEAEEDDDKDEPGAP
ncbi:hypothetical protein K2X85_18750 [bacterium]|nr:hypothetical protein [bacterium]